jgi:hypothetical protein
MTWICRLGVPGCKDVPTPNIDLLAADGVVVNRYTRSKVSFTLSTGNQSVSMWQEIRDPEGGAIYFTVPNPRDRNVLAGRVVWSGAPMTTSSYE